jgi:hypothetical protein
MVETRKSSASKHAATQAEAEKQKEIKVVQPQAQPQPQPQVAKTQNNPKNQKKNTQRKVVEEDPSSSITFFVIFTSVCLVLAAVGFSFLPENFATDFILNGAERHVNKPFKTLADFYPFYLQEHSDPTNRIFHFCGTSLVILTLLLDPVLLQSLLIAFFVGYTSCTLFAGLPNGTYEGLLVLFTFLFFAAGNAKFKKAIFVLVLGYSFAWVGHFYFELNKPATFIYPSYSLVSDFRMWIDMVMGTVPGLREIDTILKPLLSNVQTKATQFISQYQ